MLISFSFISTIVELGWHALFDRGRWFMVPEKSARTSILEKLKDIKKQRGSTKAVDAPESTSYWPLFETVRISQLCHLYVLTKAQVITEPDKVYSYRFVNVDIVNNAFTVMDNDSWTLVNVRNIDHPLLTLQSHIHPLHVILNAYPKIQAWTPRPTDAPTLEIIGDIAAIWEVWNSVPPTSEYLRYSETDSADNSSLGTLSTTISRNHLSGYHGPRKRGKSDDEGDEQQGPTTRARRFYGQRRRIDDIFYELSSTSQEASVDSLDSEYMINIQGWQDRLHTARLSSARDPGLDEDEEVRDSVNGSPKVTGYTRWEPLWDRRHPDTTQFSSNDWALLRNGCDLSGEYRPVALKDL